MSGLCLGEHHRPRSGLRHREQPEQPLHAEVFDRVERVLFSALDDERGEDQNHRQRERQGRRVEGDGQTGRDLGQRRLQLIGRDVRNGHRDPDDRSQKAEDRHGPSDRANQRVAIVQPTRCQIGEIVQMAFESVGRTASDDIVAHVANASDEVSFRAATSHQIQMALHRTSHRHRIGLRIEVQSVEQIGRQRAPLGGDSHRLHEQRRDPDEKQPGRGVLDPVCGEVSFDRLLVNGQIGQGGVEREGQRSTPQPRGGDDGI